MSTSSSAQDLLGDASDISERQKAIADRVRQVGNITKPAQAAEFFDNKQYKSVGSQQCKGDCFFCTKQVTSTGSTRQVEHILICPVCPADVKQAFKALACVLQRRSFTHQRRVGQYTGSML